MARLIGPYPIFTMNRQNRTDMMRIRVGFEMEMRGFNVFFGEKEKGGRKDWNAEKIGVHL